MRKRYGWVVVSSWLAVSPGFAQPRTLVPDGALVTFRIEDPRALPDMEAPGAKALLAGFAQFLGLPSLEGIALDRSWFGFAVVDDDELGPWVVLPIADRAAFDASVVGLRETMGILVEKDYALLGARPLHGGGGELPDRRTEALLELQAHTGALYQLFAEDMEATAILAELEQERAIAEALESDYKPPFDWSEIRNRVLPQYQTWFGILEQSELTTIELGADSERVEFGVEVVFEPESEMAKLVANQQPARPSGLDVLTDRSFVKAWLNVRFSENAGTFETFFESFAETLGFSGEHYKQLALGDAETVLGLSFERGRAVLENVYEPKGRTIEDYRRIAHALHGDASSSELLGVQRVFETEIARAGEMAVDRLTEYSAAAPGEPTAVSYFAWGDEKLYSSVVVGEGADDAFTYLNDLVSQPSEGVADDFDTSVDEVPPALVLFSWMDLESWDRARVGDVIPPMTPASDAPVMVLHGTTDAAVVRFGGWFDVAQLEAMGAREEEIAAATAELFDEGQAFLNGTGVPTDPAAARERYGKAAALGHAEATYAMGYLYASGLGVERSYDEALAWYGRAAAAGNSQALVESGHIYFHGQGRDADDAAAFLFYQTAAMMGSAQGQVSLGYMFETGRGVDEDLDVAAEWLSLVIIDTNGPPVARPPPILSRWCSESRQGESRSTGCKPCLGWGAFYGLGPTPPSLERRSVQSL